MCLSPIPIKNINYGNTSKLGFLADTTSQYILIPCGLCSVCLQLKQQYLVQRVQMEALSHDLYFGTLTYNNESLKHHIVGEFNLSYVDISDWQKMIKMIRKHEHLPPFKYFLVTEYGGRRHRPHIHFILSFPKDDKQTLADKWSFQQYLFDVFLKYWRRNRGSTRYPLWQNLCSYYRTPRSYNYDLHYLDPYASSKGLDDIAFYVSKYCLKYDKWVDKLKSKLYFNLSEDEFKTAWEKIKPKRLISKGFGSAFDTYCNECLVSPQDPKVIEHLNKGIKLALEDSDALFPYFISPVNGQTFPLAPYFSKRLLSVPEQIVFNSRKPVLTDYDMMLDSSKDLSVQQIDTKFKQFAIIQDWLMTRHTLEDDSADNTNYFSIEPEYETKKTPSFLSSDFDDWDDF